ncbi:hypothetical protein K456DRAFT_56932, partial [Colletotrichum gloeosporioides 23]
MSQYSEYDVHQALEAIANGQSLRKAASEWGIPRTTLQRRIQGIQPKNIAFTDHQRLSPT